MAQSAPRKRPVGQETKNARIELRVSGSAKALIQRAVSVSGLTPGDLAYEGARRVLDEHERMVLAGADRDAFLKALHHITYVSMLIKVQKNSDVFLSESISKVSFLRGRLLVYLR